MQNVVFAGTGVVTSGTISRAANGNFSYRPPSFPLSARRSFDLNVGGNAYAVVLLSPALFTDTHDSQHYADLCASQDLRPMVTGCCDGVYDFSPTPDYCGAWNCLRGSAAWSFSNEWVGLLQALFQADSTVWAVMFSPDADSESGHHFVSAGGIMNSRGGVGRDEDWEDFTYSPVCGREI
jgi:hypothetical protein